MTAEEVKTGTAPAPPQRTSQKQDAAKGKFVEMDTPLTDDALDREANIEMGHLNVAEQAAVNAQSRVVNARDSRAYRLNQAQKNEAANDEVNAREVDLVNEARERGFGQIIDPDRMREESLASSLAEIDQHTPEGMAKLRASRDAIAEARRESGNPTPVPGGAKVLDRVKERDTKDAAKKAM